MLRASLFAVITVLAAACSSTTVIQGPSSSSGGTEDAGTDSGGSTGPFTITSTAVEEGAAIPRAHVCTTQMGMNTSPPLAWSGAPVGTKSFAIVFNDATTSFLHSVIYDIPPDRTDLPENVAKTYQPSNVPGAKQTRAYTNMFGYAGPCPSSKHTYEFVLYALDVDALPNMTMTTALAAAETEIKKHVVESTKLTVTHTP
jgi:Raf kinase inhibitor-like YbhB/YbcL family protein